MQALSILVVEDNPLAVELLKTYLEGHRIDSVANVDSAKRKFTKTKYDLCFIDLELGDKDECSGLTLIEHARAKGAYTVVMSGHGSEAIVERAYALGCDDFYAKGNEGVNVGLLLEKFHRLNADDERDSLFNSLFVTQDPATRASVEEALKYAPSTLPLLILGPSGTGKTSLARIIHERSNRRGDFVAINCSAYTEDLLEAELFGYRKGAFTGAADHRKGKLLQAAGGTLFLDEIGSMSLKMQTKLLKAIEEKSFYPLGSDTTEKSDFRVMSATLEDLQTLIKIGQLRFDFYQRIHGLTVTLKPLSERQSDIFPLIESFTQGGKLLSFTAEAKRAILAHGWQGNIRELKKFVELLVAGGQGQVSNAVVRRLLTALPDDGSLRSFATDEQYRYALSEGTPAATARFIDSLIERNLAAHGGKRTRVLADLKIGTSALYASLRRIQPENINKGRRTDGKGRKDAV